MRMRIYLQCSLALLALTSMLLPGCQGADSEELGDSNWLERLSNGGNDTWLLKFFAPWCPACRRLEPAWRLLAGRADEVDWLRVGHVDVAKEEVVGGMFLVTQLPTVYLYTPDGSFRQFEFSSVGPGADDQRLVEAWLRFARPGGGHSGVAPLPWYRTPTAIHVRCMAWLIRGALGVRNLHSRLTGPPIGMSVHLAYLVILCLAVAFGAGLILCLVCCCDRFCPEDIAELDTVAEQSALLQSEKPDADAAVTTRDDSAEASGQQLRRRPVAADGDASTSETGERND